MLSNSLLSTISCLCRVQIPLDVERMDRQIDGSVYWINDYRFSTKESATHAIVAVHNTDINGQTVKCSWGKESGDPNNAQAAGQVSEQVNVLICSVFFTHVGRNSYSLRAGRSGDRIPVGARFSAAVQTGPGAHPSSCTMGTGSFPGVKRPGCGVDHLPPASAEIKERVEIYVYSLNPQVTCALSWKCIPTSSPSRAPNQETTAWKGRKKKGKGKETEPPTRPPVMTGSAHPPLWAFVARCMMNFTFALTVDTECTRWPRNR